MRYILIISLLVLALPRTVVAASPSPSPLVSPSPSAVPVPLAGELRINEFLPNPVGTDTGHEWIELANVSTHDVAAGGLVIARLSGSNLVTVPGGTTVKAGDVLLLSTLSGSIVNSGDTIVLKSGTTELDRVTYDDLGGEGQSWVRFSSSEGMWSSAPTPGEPNPSQDLIAEAEADDDAADNAGVATSATTKVSASSTKAAAAKKASAKKLPTSGPGAGMYVAMGLLAMLYWYARRRII